MKTARFNFPSPAAPHRCYWCGGETTSMFWACERCYPLKEAGYRRAKSKGLTNRADIIAEVHQTLAEAGVKIAA